MRTKIKEILTIMFSAAIMLAITACKAEDSTSQSESDPIAHEAAAITTTLSFSTTTTTTTTTTTARRTTTTSKATTTTTATTTTVVTTTTIPQTTSTATIVAANTTTAGTTAATTAQTTAVTTIATSANTLPNGVCSTVVMAEGEPITVYYYDEKPENATLQAYSDLAEYGILTDEIRQLITDDVMNYANTKYGYVKDDSLYANSTTDYSGGFHGGAKNNSYSREFDTVALMIKWGIKDSNYIMPSLNERAKEFQARMYGWVDTTAEWEIEVYGSSPEDLIGWGSNVGFCSFGTDSGGYTCYQVSFIY